MKSNVFEANEAIIKAVTMLEDFARKKNVRIMGTIAIDAEDAQEGATYHHFTLNDFNK